MRWTFGDCVLDTDTRLVFRAGEPVRLGPKAYELLQVLLACRPKVLSKRELYQRLWPGTSVSESSLSTVVAELREALGDDARVPRYVRTVYGFGYAFVAPVVPAEPAAARALASVTTVHVRGNGRHYTLGAGAHIIGRMPEAAITIDELAVSRHHARIVVSSGVATVEDLGSRNGTFRNGERLTGITTLQPGDVLGVGPVALHVESIRTVSSLDTITAAQGTTQHA